MNSQRFFILFIFFLLSCTSNDQQNFRKKKLQVDLIERSMDDNYYSDGVPETNPTLLYPFEDKSSLFTITKDFFRCKGNPLNPQRTNQTDINNVKTYSDCEGFAKHGLPLINSKKGVYPILIDLLNYIQKKTNKKVVITCGYRCSKHNTYADILDNAKSSKHMIGAEVDFYVQGLEQSPEKIVNIILEFYNENPRYKGKQQFAIFKRSEDYMDVTIQPWFNKEIFMKIYKSNEGRDFDNRHPYPYICVQVLWDRSSREVVNFK